MPKPTESVICEVCGFPFYPDEKMIVMICDECMNKDVKLRNGPWINLSEPIGCIMIRLNAIGGEKAPLDVRASIVIEDGTVLQKFKPPIKSDPMEVPVNWYHRLKARLGLNHKTEIINRDMYLFKINPPLLLMANEEYWIEFEMVSSPE